MDATGFVRGTLFACALAVVAATPARAGAPEPSGAREVDGGALTLAEAMQAAENDAPAVLVATARAMEAQGDVNVARAFRDPQILIGTTSASAVFVGGLSWWLPVFRQRHQAIEAARARAYTADVRSDVARADARLAVSLAWIDLWLADRVLALGHEDAARRERLHEIAQARFDDGAAPRIDIVRANGEAQRARAELRALGAQRTLVSAQLALLLGRDPDAALTTTGDPPSASSGERDASVDEHPRVLEALAGARASEAEVRNQKRSRWPLVGVSVQNWLNSHQRANPGGPPGFTSDWRVLVTMDVPLFDGARVKRARLAGDVASVQLEATRNEVAADIARARAAFSAADERARAAAEAVLPVALEAADLSQEAYAAGGLDLTGAIGAEQGLADARLASAQAVADRGRAVAVLDHATGAFDR